MKILNYNDFLNETKKEPVVHIHLNAGRRAGQTDDETWCGNYSLGPNAKVVSEKNYEKATCKKCIKLFKEKK